MKKTWLQAIKHGEFATWPGLTYDLVAKHLSNDTEETAAGHLHRRRQGIRSTKNNIMDLEPELEGNKTINMDCTQRVGIHLVPMSELNGMIATDQTGRFPIISQQGNKYTMILYSYDSNAILAEPAKGRTGKDQVEVYNELHDRLVKAGV